MRLLILLAAFVVLSIGFGLVERFWPSIRGQKRLRQGFFTDFAYWLFLPTVSKAFSGVFVFLVVLGAAALLAAPISGDALREGINTHETFISRWPIGMQVIVFVLLADFIGYWSHRSFHGIERLWRIHAVHHSSTQVDWLSSVRVHPLNDAISSAVVATPLLLLGFAPATLAAYLPFLTLYAIGLHANVGWSYGPLRYVISSPVFHRWHHSAEAAALNKNFAGLFPLYDWLFGTLYLPKGVQPALFGAREEPVPAGFIGQLAYPLRRHRKLAAEPAPA
jgi:sterol desaturase/sphingolipid hydroxylase (fatty acid hydroxylase superfamily)